MDKQVIYLIYFLLKKCTVRETEHVIRVEITIKDAQSALTCQRTALLLWRCDFHWSNDKCRLTVSAYD